jgi:hypothetical protein
MLKATTMALMSARYTAIAPSGHAVDLSGEDGAPERASAYVSVSFFGGVLMPFGAGSDGLKQGLSAGLRAGWTSRIGLGVDVVATYSPLPRSVEEGERVQSIYATSVLMPRYTVGQGKLRASLAGGGGAAMDRTTRTVDGMSDVTSTRWAAAVTGTAAIELHLLDGGGFFLGGAYTRLVDDLEYQYAEGHAGLIFTFD